MKFVSSRPYFLAAVAAVGFLPLTASANGLAIFKQEVNNGKAQSPSQVWQDSAFFSRAVDRAWAKIRPDLEWKIVQELGRGDRFARGFTFYRISLNLARTGQLRLEPRGGNEMLMTFTLNGTYLRFTSTLPGPLGSWADPTMEVRFNAAVRMVVTLPSTSADPKVTWIGGQITWLQLHTKNVLVGAAIAVVGPQNVQKIMQWGLNFANSKLSKEVNIPLGKVSPLMQPLRRLGYTEMHSQVQNGRVVVTLIKRTHKSSVANLAKAKAKAKATTASQPGPGNRLDNVLLNPQPLPPRITVPPLPNPGPVIR